MRAELCQAHSNFIIFYSVQGILLCEAYKVLCKAYKVQGVPEDCLTRQVREAVQIRRSQVPVLNSKTEWHQPALWRIQTEIYRGWTGMWQYENDYVFGKIWTLAEMDSGFN